MSPCSPSRTTCSVYALRLVSRRPRTRPHTFVMQLRRNTRVRTATIDRAPDFGATGGRTPLSPSALPSFAAEASLALAKFAEHVAGLFARERVRNDSLRTRLNKRHMTSLLPY